MSSEAATLTAHSPAVPGTAALRAGTGLSHAPALHQALLEVLTTLALIYCPAAREGGLGCERATALWQLAHLSPQAPSLKAQHLDRGCRWRIPKGTSRCGHEEPAGCFTNRPRWAHPTQPLEGCAMVLGGGGSTQQLLPGNCPPSQVREAQEIQLHLSWGPSYAPGPLPTHRLPSYLSPEVRPRPRRYL